MRNLLEGRIAVIALIVLVLAGITNSCLEELDVAPPVTTILHPAANDAVSGSTPIVVTASDDENLKEIRLYIDGVSVKTEGSSVLNYDWNTSTLPPNTTHNIVAYAEDDAGNVGPSAITSVTVTDPASPLDQTPPALTITSPAAGGVFSVATLTNATLNISADATDENGVDNVEVFIDGASVFVDTEVPYSFSWDVSAVDRTLHTIFVKATDVNGNSSGQLVTVTIND